MWRCALPPLPRYPTVDELVTRAAALVARSPRHARLRRVGTSRAGTPLWLLSVGHGTRHVLIVAGPHANEPCGGATALHLAERVLADPAPGADTDVTYDLLLCVDPDGLRRNEGWLHGPYTLSHYFRNFFRPGFREQPEWLPGGPGAAALPETRALLALQDELRPVLQCSLHGVDVGGGFLELTHDLPGIARRLARTAARHAVPRELGPYDTLYWPVLGPSVYRIPHPRHDGPAAVTTAPVDSTWLHPYRHGTVTAVVEAPMWGVAAVQDGSVPADPDRALRAVSGALRHDTRLLETLLARCRPHLAAAPDAAALLAPVDDHLLICPRLADAWDPDTRDRDGPRTLPPLTTAHLTALRLAGRRLALRTAGLLHQLVRRAGTDPTGTLPALDHLLDLWCADFHDGCGARWIPVERQVAYQTQVVLHTVDLALRRTGGPSRSGESGWGSGTAVPMHQE
ncbi:M14 family zinc carboxypeptidase [Streptomyces sp. NPDC048290]|uniref:M14 family zinc carboxypeptidase n=1 Tax=Streptomyces sp. NPDC048290 TaxID=3155811 RepID=UPI003427DE1F